MTSYICPLCDSFNASPLCSFCGATCSAIEMDEPTAVCPVCSTLFGIAAVNCGIFRCLQARSGVWVNPHMAKADVDAFMRSGVYFGGCGSPLRYNPVTKGFDVIIDEFGRPDWSK